MITYFITVGFTAVGYHLFRRVRLKGHDLSWLMMIPFAILFIFTSHNPDYQVYMESFVTGEGPFYEAGLRVVATLLGKIGLKDYRVFLLLVVGLVFLTFRTWAGRTKHIGSVLFLYSLFVLFYDVIQVRFTIAVMFILLALYYAIENRKILCILFCVLAVFFHRLSALACLMILYLFLVKPKKDYSLSRWEISLMVLIGLAGCFLSRPVVSLIAQRSAFFTRISLYMTAGAGFDSLVIWVGYEIFLILALYFLGYLSVINDPFTEPKTKETVNRLFRFMFFGIAVSGFLLFVEEFNRMYRMFYVTGYLIFALIEDHMSKANRYVLFWTMSAVSILFMVIAMLRGINFDLYW